MKRVPCVGQPELLSALQVLLILTAGEGHEEGPSRYHAIMNVHRHRVAIHR